MASVTTTVTPVEDIRKTLNASQQSGLDADVENINRTYDNIASEAYAAQLASSRALKNQAAANGLGKTGYTETSQLALQNNYMNNLLENEYARAEAIQDADKYYQELAAEEEQQAYEREMEERAMALQENQFTYQQEQDSLDRETAAEQTAYDREQDAKNWEYLNSQLTFDQNLSEREMALQEAEFAYEQYINGLSLSGSGSSSGSSSVNASGEPTGSDVSAYEDYYGDDENVQTALSYAQRFVANAANSVSNSTALQANFSTIVKEVEKRYGTAAAEAYSQYVSSNLGWGSGTDANLVSSLYTTFMNSNGNKSDTAFSASYNTTYNAIKSSYGEDVADAFASYFTYTYDDASYALKAAASASAAKTLLQQVQSSDVLTSAEQKQLMDDYETYWGNTEDTTAELRTAMDKLNELGPIKYYLENGEWLSDATKTQASQMIKSLYPSMQTDLLAVYGLT